MDYIFGSGGTYVFIPDVTLEEGPVEARRDTLERYLQHLFLSLSMMLLYVHLSEISHRGKNELSLLLSQGQPSSFRSYIC